MKKLLSVFVIALLVTSGAAFAAKPAAKAPAKAATATTMPAKGEKSAESTAKPAPVAAPEGKCPEATEEAEAPKQPWPDKGVFGHYDTASVQRGFQVYREVCSNCHSLKFLSYRDLQDLGYTPDQVKAVAASVTVQDGPNDEGQMFDRPGRPSDHFKSPFPNEKAARAANNGALPPDMSLLAKAREGGEDYIYAILTGYSQAPSCVNMFPGMNWNKYFPPHQIAMPKPLNDGQVSFSDGSPNSLPDEARNVAQFLAWASEPRMEQRKEMGIKVLLFLFVFVGVMAASKCKVWEDVR
jgi:ubiquinol-cytochrome c reductase cytochrome c1 subunit